MKNAETGAPGKALPAWIAALCLLVSFAGIADHELWTPDEPREAALALAMSRSGNIVVPELAGEPFVEKPPLYYILASSALAYLGPLIGNTPALRLTSALLGLGALGMTWLLARRLMDGQRATLSALILATMPGFIQVTHWLLSDNALVFFVAAALWALAEAYAGRRPGFLAPAGLFAAGAFLSKGLIGLLVIGLGWLGLFLPRMIGPGRRGLFTLKYISMHAVALLVLAIPALAWAWEFRRVGGTELWHAWFWTNHFGRFSGSAVDLGHIQGPFYYLESAPLFMLPWIALLVPGLAALLFRRGRLKSVMGPWPFLLAWGVGGLIMFSLSATKRDIYLVVLLPAFAMMTALVLASLCDREWEIGPKVPAGATLAPPTWARVLLATWTASLLILLAIVILAPILDPILPLIAPRKAEAIAGVLNGWRATNTLAALSLLLAALIIAKRSLPFLHRWFAATALAYIMLLALLCPMIDTAKNYGPAFDNLARGAGVPPGKAVAWNPDETTRAGFYYYCDLIFPVVSDKVELALILNGAHPQFTEAIVSSRNFPPDAAAFPEWVVLQSERMGPSRVLQRIGPKKQ